MNFSYQTIYRKSAPPTYVIAGSTGLIGSSLCKSIAAAGLSYITFPRSLVSILGTSSQVLESELLEYCRSYIPSGSIVVNCAWQGRPLLPVVDSFSSPLFSTRLARISRELNASHHIFFSSAGAIYGCNRSLTEAHTETSQPNPTSVYGRQKLDAERDILRLFRNSTILRVSNVYDVSRPNIGHGILPAAFKAFTNGAPLKLYGDGSQRKDYISVQDTVSAVLQLSFKKTDKSIINISSGYVFSVTEIINSLSKALNIQPLITYNPSHPNDIPISVISNSLLVAETGWCPSDHLLTQIKSCITQTIL